MPEIPEFWRTKVWHPLSVHLPIGILLAAVLFKFMQRIQPKSMWNLGGSILLYLGTTAAWISIYTGNLADGIVSRHLCDPTILKDHENMAYLTAWLFTAAAALDLLQFLGSRILKMQVLSWMVVVLMLVATGFL